MRLSVFARLAPILVAAAVSACDSRTLTGSANSARVSMAIPRLGVALGASQYSQAATTSTFDLAGAHVRITMPSSGAVLLDRTFQFTPNPDPNSPIAGTIEVQFQFPAGTAHETFSFGVDVLSSDGTVLFTMGPTAFQLGADGRSASVEGTATYVGPGSSVTSVNIQPRSVAVQVGQAQPVTCTGNPGATTDFPFILATDNVGIAAVEDASLVRGVSPGTTRLRCTLQFGTHATDSISVVVTAVVSTGGISGVVQSASNGLPLSGVLVEVRAGSATTGPTAAPSVTTGPTGAFSFTNLTPGSYTLLATATGFAAVNVATSVVAGQTQAVTIALPPVATSGISIVLTWGAIPNDLDSYLYLPSGPAVYYGSPGSCVSTPFACLVNDETSPNSSEFTNITSLSTGTYTFRVADYTHWSSGVLNSTDLSHSNARVDVFVSGVLQRTFTVPNQAGVLWTVFTLSGSISSPTITTVNTMQALPPP